MTKLSFTTASKAASRLRLAIIGPSGAGKTFTALRVATGLGGRIAVVDTEHGSASKYADRFQFDVLELDSFSPATYVGAIHAAEAAGYDALIIDSLSHAWMGKDGALEQVDKIAARSKTNNTFGAWRDVTPMHQRLIDAMIASRLHLIATMRQKTEYVVEDVNGKKTPRKVGTAPVQRDGMEFEFDVVLEMDQDNRAIVSKTRCPALRGALIEQPGEELAQTLREWLAGAPPSGDQQAFEVLCESIARCTTEAQLADLAQDCRSLPETWRERVRAIYGQRLEHLRQAAASAPQPAPATRTIPAGVDPYAGAGKHTGD